MVKMRINSKQTSKCQGCGNKWKNVKEMYDLAICDQKFTLCFDCCDKIFHKLLKASCMYQSKLKSQDDMVRIRNNNIINNPEPIKEKEVMPNCYGDFLKQKKCKKCKFIYECKETFNEQWEDC